LCFVYGVIFSSAASLSPARVSLPAEIRRLVTRAAAAATARGRTRALAAFREAGGERLLGR
jgi:hypothetical protein